MFFGDWATGQTARGAKRKNLERVPTPIASLLRLPGLILVPSEDKGARARKQLY